VCSLVLYVMCLTSSFRLVFGVVFYMSCVLRPRPVSVWCCILYVMYLTSSFRLVFGAVFYVMCLTSSFRLVFGVVFSMPCVFFLPLASNACNL
jgi:hypothetical protein